MSDGLVDKKFENPVRFCPTNNSLLYTVYSTPFQFGSEPTVNYKRFTQFESIELLVFANYGIVFSDVVKSTVVYVVAAAVFSYTTNNNSSTC